MKEIEEVEPTEDGKRLTIGPTITSLLLKWAKQLLERNLDQMRQQLIAVE